jgi:long-subunit fatty acid transport protein
LAFLLILFSTNLFSQSQAIASKTKSEFWKNVQFGGGFGLNIGSGFTDITLAPSGIYNFNQSFSAGIGLQGSYVSSKNNYSSAIYGVNLISLINPIDDFQISVELEQLRVNRTVMMIGAPNLKDNFWNTGLFIGCGYGSDNVIVGVRYNVLYKESDFVYNTAFMPFVRVYF